MAALSASVFAASIIGCGADLPDDPASDDPRVPVAVLGDSDSHSYGDRLTIRGSGARGGSLRESTLQWTEIWSRLRADEVDLGAWGRWGSAPRTARMLRLAGVTMRAPRKEDFRHNFALSGARCTALTEGVTGQVEPLLRELSRDVERWSRGIVIIRIGVNSFGQPEHLDRLAAGEDVPEIPQCVRRIGEAVRAIRARAPGIRFVLVGIFDNAHWAKVTDRWQDTTQLRNIARALDEFDAGLMALATNDPGIAFHDDRAWMASHWGGRGPDGRPAYTPFLFPDGFTVTNTAGDDPTNVVVQDGHMGTAANGLWLNSLMEAVNAQLGTAFTPIPLTEIAELARAR